MWWIIGAVCISFMFFLCAGARAGLEFCIIIRDLYIARNISTSSIGYGQLYGPETKDKKLRAAIRIRSLMGFYNPARWKLGIWIAVTGLVSLFFIYSAWLFLASKTWWIVGGFIEIIMAVLFGLYVYFWWSDTEWDHLRNQLSRKDYNSARITAWCFRILILAAFSAGISCVISGWL